MNDEASPFWFRWPAAIMSVLLASILMSCGGNPGGSVGRVTSVTVEPSAAEIMLGGEIELTASVNAVGDVNHGVTWSTSDGMVASVAQGAVRGVGVGSTTVIAASAVTPSIRGVSAITVLAPPTVVAPVAPGEAAARCGGEPCAVEAVVEEERVTFRVAGATVGISVVDGAGGVGGDGAIVVPPNAALALDGAGLSPSEPVRVWQIDGVTPVALLASVTPNADGTASFEVTLDSTAMRPAADVNLSILVTFVNAAGHAITLHVGIDRNDAEGPPRVEGVAILGAARRSVDVGATTSLAVVVTAVGGAPTTVAWSSANPSIAVVDDGVVTGVAVGTTIVRATSTFDPSKSASVSIEVRGAGPPAGIESVAIPGEGTRSIRVGDVVALTAVVNATGGAATSVLWMTASESVASVSDSGLVTGVGVGSTIVTATSTVDPSKSASVVVHVAAGEHDAAVLGVAIDGSAVKSVGIDAVRLLIANVTVVGDVPTTVTWSSADEGVATVNGFGLVTGVAGGTTSVTATSTFDPTKFAAVTVNVPQVLSIAIDGAAERVVAEGATLELQATLDVLGEAATDVAWSSDDAAVVTVTADGLVRGAAVGSAVVTATSEADPNMTASVRFTVPGVASLVIPGARDRALMVGASEELSATVVVFGGVSPEVTWSTSDASIVTVTEAGSIGAVSPGTAVVTAASSIDERRFAAVTVTVTERPPDPAVLGLSIAGDATRTLRIGSTAQLTATVTAVGGAATTITYATSHPAVATVTATGLVTAVSGGSATITATSTFDPTKTAFVTVNVPAVNAVAIAGAATRTVNVGATTPLAATVTALGAAATTVSWSSSNSGVAAVNPLGLVTGVAGGTATITATSSFDPSKAASVTVNVPVVTGVSIAGAAARTVNVGATAQLAATVTAVGGAATTVTWSSNDPSVATVNASGLLTGVAGGTATITAASSFDASKVASVTVNVPSLARLALSGAATHTAGEVGTLTITAFDSLGNVATHYAGVKALLFSGANAAPDGTRPTVEGVPFGTSTAVTFVGGVATVSVTLQAAESATIACTDGIIGTSSGAGFTTSVRAGAIDAARSAVAAASTGVADGVTGTAVTVSVVDARGNPVPARSVTLEQGSGTSAVITPPSASTDEGGIASFTVANALAEAVTLSAVVGAVNLAGSVVITFVTDDLPTGGPSLTLGYLHGFLTDQDGVWGWGRNHQGQLGDGTTSTRLRPISLHPSWEVAAFAAGEWHTLGLLADGRVIAFGSNESGQLGTGATSNALSPVVVPGLTNVVAIAAGQRHSLALRRDGTVWAWGLNDRNQLGDGTTTNRTSPQRVPNLAGVAAISAGDQHALALLDDATVRAWGFNGSGQIGDGGGSNRATPFALALTGVTAVSAGDDHSMALLANGDVLTWGANWAGQLGDGTTTIRRTPFKVTSIANAAAIQAGFNHSLALLADGTVRAWGFNGRGNLGDGSTTNRLTPIAVPSLANVTHLAGGLDLTAARTADGSVHAWGRNDQGAVGNGATTDQRTPTCIHRCPAATMVDAATSTVTASPASVPANGSTKSTITVTLRNAAGDALAGKGVTLTQAGTSATIGAASGMSDARGVVTFDVTHTTAEAVTLTAVGDGVTITQTATVTFTSPIAAAMNPRSRIAGSHRHSLVLLANGTVAAWGSTTTGANGFTTGSRTPRVIPNLSNVVQVLAGDHYPGSTAPDYGYSLALDANGGVWSWGSNYAGTLGRGTAITSSATPARVTIAAPITKLATGMGQVLAVDTSGNVWSWGDGPIGDGTETNAYTPVRLTTISDVVDVATAHGASFALLANGTVRAWRSRPNSGADPNLPITTPIPVVTSSGAELTGIVRLLASGLSTAMYAEDVNGTVWGWGLRSRFDASGSFEWTAPSAAPVGFLPAGSTVTGGWNHLLAVKPDGTMIAWGQNNAWGRFGSSGPSTPQPVDVVGIDGVVSIGGGRDHSLAIRSNGSVWAWGRNASATLGDGTVTDRFTPVCILECNAATPAVQGVAIAGAATRTLGVGAATQLTATVTAVGGAATNVTWSSSAPAIASVSASGLVTAHAGGTATITAVSTFDATKSAAVTVLVPVVVSVSIAGDATRTLFVGSTVSLTATVTAAGGADPTVTWASTNPSAATVDASGLVTALAEGTATITASSAFDPTQSASVTIVVARIANTLNLATQPDGTVPSGAVMARQPVVSLRGEDGVPLTTPGIRVSATLEAGTPNSVLSGTTSVLTDEFGVAAFVNLSIAGVAGAHALRFEAEGFAPVVSERVDVVAGAVSAAASSVTRSPEVVRSSGSSLITVRLRDAQGNALSASAGVVTIDAALAGAFGPVTDHQDGTYTATYTPGRFAGRETVRARIEGALIPSGDVTVTADPWFLTGAGVDRIRDVVALPDGSTLIAAQFTGTRTIGDRTIVGNGEADVLVAKFDPSGAVVWVATAGAAGHDSAHAVAQAPDGSVYVTGAFYQTVSFGPSRITSSGEADVFVAKISATGDWQWAIRGGGASWDFGYHIGVLSDGTAVFFGQYRAGPATFGSSTFASSGDFDLVLGRLNANGSFQWVIRAGGSSWDTVGSMVVRSDDSVVVTGLFRHSVAFGSTTLTSAGHDEVFVANLSSAGQWRWATRAGGTGADSTGGIVELADGSFIVAGLFSGTASFGSHQLTSAGGSDIFVARLGANRVWEWARRVGSTGNDLALAVDRDTDGNAFITGYFRGTASFGTHTLTSVGVSDAYLGMITPSGTWFGAQRLGFDLHDTGLSVAVSNAGRVMVAGITDGPNICDTFNVCGETNGFLWTLPWPN